jgi:NIMA (never in mitosis gene a)-related kinase
VIAKIGDLNVSTVHKRDQLCKTQTGTPYYASPEIWADQGYSFPCDIWSLGCILYEMLTYNPPFKAENVDELFGKVKKGVYPPIDDSVYSSNIIQMVAFMLQVTPKLRPTADQILNHNLVQYKVKKFWPDQVRDFQPLTKQPNSDSEEDESEEDSDEEENKYSGSKQDKLLKTIRFQKQWDKI